MTTRKHMIAVRLTKEERTTLQQAAEKAGLTLSQWMRLVGLTAAGNYRLLQQLTETTIRIPQGKLSS